VTDQGDELTLLDGEVDITQGVEGTFTGMENHFGVLYFDELFHVSSGLLRK
jgi:hypothetical protein